MKETICELYHDNFQNYKRYNIKKAQLVIADIPYNIGENAYGSNPQWYEGGDNKNGESKFAKSNFFNGDGQFNIAEYFHFCNNLLIKEPKEKGEAGCMILFCALEQFDELKKYAKEYGFNNSIPLIFRKNYSAQVLKANMRPVGNFECALIFYRDKLPKFRNNGKMVFQNMEWMDDRNTPKIHPTQKPVPLLEFLIQTFTDIDDVVIDCCAGSGTTLLAAANLGRRAYGFELKKQYVDFFYEKLLPIAQEDMFTQQERAEKKMRQLEMFPTAKKERAAQ